MLVYISQQSEYLAAFLLKKTIIFCYYYYFIITMIKNFGHCLGKNTSYVPTKAIGIADMFEV